jgi:hypothetical protein
VVEVAAVRFQQLIKTACLAALEVVQELPVLALPILLALLVQEYLGKVMLVVQFLHLARLMDMPPQAVAVLALLDWVEISLLVVDGAEMAALE